MFGSDPLDEQECLFFTPGGAGFCNPGVTPQVSRLLTFPCPYPPVCEDFMDGTSTGSIFADLPGSSASYRLVSMQVTVHGTITATVDLDVKPGELSQPDQPS